MPEPPAHRLLIVDDESSVTFAMARYFTLQGWEAESASELGQARALIEERRFDVLLADIKLGPGRGSEGFALARFAHERSPATKIVVLTAYLTDELLAEATAHHATLVLRKPLPLPELAQMLLVLVGPLRLPELRDDDNR